MVLIWQTMEILYSNSSEPLAEVNLLKHVLWSVYLWVRSFVNPASGARASSRTLAFHAIPYP